MICPHLVVGHDKLARVAPEWNVCLLGILILPCLLVLTQAEMFGSDCVYPIGMLYELCNVVVHMLSCMPVCVFVLNYH
jgi:hypothetical protein